MAIQVINAKVNFSSFLLSNEKIQRVTYPYGFRLREVKLGGDWYLFRAEDCPDFKYKKEDYIYYVVDFISGDDEAGATYTPDPRKYARKVPEGIIFTGGKGTPVRGIFRVPKGQKKICVFYLFGEWLYVDPQGCCYLLGEKGKTRLGLGNKILFF